MPVDRLVHTCCQPLSICQAVTICWNNWLNNTVILPILSCHYNSAVTGQCSAMITMLLQHCSTINTIATLLQGYKATTIKIANKLVLSILFYLFQKPWTTVVASPMLNNIVETIVNNIIETIVNNIVQPWYYPLFNQQCCKNLSYFWLCIFTVFEQIFFNAIARCMLLACMVVTELAWVKNEVFLTKWTSSAELWAKRSDCLAVTLWAQQSWSTQSEAMARDSFSQLHYPRWLWGGQ